MESEELVPVEVGGKRVLLAVSRASFEEEISGGLDVNVQDAVDGAIEVANVTLASSRGMAWRKATLTLGIEFAVESGTLMAVIGKAGAKSSIQLTLEFDDELPAP